MLDECGDFALEDKTSNLALASAKLERDSDSEIWHSQVPNLEVFPFDDYLSIGFTHHRVNCCI